MKQLIRWGDDDFERKGLELCNVFSPEINYDGDGFWRLGGFVAYVCAKRNKM